MHPVTGFHVAPAEPSSPRVHSILVAVLIGCPASSPAHHPRRAQQRFVAGSRDGASTGHLRRPASYSAVCA
jgi:hypothetical protein